MNFSSRFVIGLLSTLALTACSSVASDSPDSAGWRAPTPLEPAARSAVAAQFRIKFSTTGESAPLGEWLEINQTTRYTATHGSFSSEIVKGGTLWICDPVGQFLEGEYIQFRHFGRYYSYQGGGWTGQTFGDALQQILVSRGQYSCDRPPSGQNAVLREYGNAYDPHEWPDFTWQVGVEIFARPSRTIGIQARTFGSCGSAATTAWPGSEYSNKILIDNQTAVGKCSLYLRLCTSPASPFHTSNTSC